MKKKSSFVRYIFLTIVLTFLFVLYYENEKKIKVLAELNSEISVLKHYIENNLILGELDNVNEYFSPVTTSKYYYELGDEVIIHGALAVNRVKNGSMKVIIEGNKTEINSDDSFYWNYKFNANDYGFDTIRGYYELDIRGKQFTRYFEHIIFVMSK